VGGVLPQERDLRGARQLAGLLLLVDPLHERRAEELHRGEQAEEVLVAAAVDVGRGAATVDVGDAVLLRDRALRLHEVARVRAEQEVDLVAVDEPVGEAHRGGLGAGVVEERQRHGQLRLPHLEAAALVHLIEGEVVAFLVEAADARLGAGERQRRAHRDTGGCAAAARLAAGGDAEDEEGGRREARQLVGEAAGHWVGPLAGAHRSALQDVLSRGARWVDGR
jgi:hypothetical protein